MLLVRLVLLALLEQAQALASAVLVVLVLFTSRHSFKNLKVTQ